MFDLLSPNLFDNYQKPATVFQLKWPLEFLKDKISPTFLSHFGNRDIFLELFKLRDRLESLYSEEVLKMVKDQDRQRTSIVFVVDELDSNETSILELLGDDIEDFFFGC